MKKSCLYLLWLVLWPLQICPAAEPLTLSLDEAVTIALANNLELELQKEEVATAQSTATGQQGQFDPIFSATGYNEITNQPDLSIYSLGEEKTAYWAASLSKKMATGTELDLTWENQRYEADSLLATIDPTYTAAVSIGVSQPLLQGWTREVQTAELEAAEKGVLAADSQLNSQAVELAAQVKTAYWELLYARQEIEVKKLSLELARRVLADTSRKIEIGTMAPVEIYQPESEVARREEALIAGERAIAAAEDSLKLILNQADWETMIIPADTPQVVAEIPPFTTILDRARQNRADLKAAVLAAEASAILVRKSEDELKPELDLEARAGFAGSDPDYAESTANVFAETDFSWKIGLTFSVPLGGHSAEGSDQAARAELAKARTSVRMIEQEIARSSREALRNLRLSLKSIEASEKTSLALAKRLEAEQHKFAAGLATTLDVLEAQESYAQALAGRKRAIIDHVLARAELQREIGQLNN